MKPRTQTALIGSVLIAALLLMGAGFPTEKVPPKQWATGVCTTVNDWVTSTENGANDLNATLTGKNAKLRDVREALTGYLGDTAQATTLVVEGLADAGTPATPKGKQAATALIDTFKKIRTSLRKLQDQAEELSVKNRAKALKQIRALNRQVSAEFASFNAAIVKLRKLDPNHKLQKAFQAEPACQQLSG